MEIPFNRPLVGRQEVENIEQAIANLHLAGDGPFTESCQAMLEELTGSPAALLTHTCTAALELASLLMDLRPGDEVIMPSFTFVSTANAVALRGATPVFVDITEDTLCIDATRVEDAINESTRAVIVVHYAGVACDMEMLQRICTRHHLVLVEDAAHSIGATYRGRPLGTFGRYATLSFHETKNVICGEGGALLVNDETALDRAQVVWEKGTNRREFLRGEVEKYYWVDVGSSFAPSEITAAFLAGQLSRIEDINNRRLRIWNTYYEGTAPLESSGVVRRPVIPTYAEHNGHLFYLLVENIETRNRLLKYLNDHGVNAVFHYVPLHSAPAGQRAGRVCGAMTNTARAGESLIRLPLWPGLTDSEVGYVLDTLAAGL